VGFFGTSTQIRAFSLREKVFAKSALLKQGIENTIIFIFTMHRVLRRMGNRYESSR
jgi:hypothetical protein